VSPLAEDACRGGPSEKKDDFGFDSYFDQPAGERAVSKANFDSRLKRTEKVGSCPANRLGLHDMHGNVFELCHDRRTDDDGGPLRLLRGGAWHDHAGLCRARHVGLIAPSSRYNGAGLRVALVREGS
jgi:eukaryotic-like serine/threonine-protein kinase